MKIFISYAHEDETLKNELLRMLKPFKREGIIEILHDRQIEAGDIWRQAIQDDMETCDIGLLLISPNFIDSEFIHNEELKFLLKRRKEEGLCVIPIILGTCTWKHVLNLGEIQALPRDDKSILSFSEQTDDRNKVWAGIAEYIKQKAENSQKKQ
jgi:hypothetical protein